MSVPGLYKICPLDKGLSVGQGAACGDGGKYWT